MMETSIATLNMMPAAWLRDSDAWLVMLIEVTGKTVVVVVLAIVIAFPDRTPFSIDYDYDYDYD